jgi:hypothetical protein
MSENRNPFILPGPGGPEVARGLSACAARSPRDCPAFPRNSYLRNKKHLAPRAVMALWCETIEI